MVMCASRAYSKIFLYNFNQLEKRRMQSTKEKLEKEKE